MKPAIEVIGGGPAGTSAAIAAVQEGAAVTLFERSRYPRHKVCGEFLSPEIVPLLERIGAAQAFHAARPSRIRRMLISTGRTSKSARLREPAFGLSRWAFDDLLFRHALAAGANRERSHVPEPRARCVWAAGRRSAQPRGTRLFGFKAHYAGPADDAVELYFFRGCYVGINTVENGATNVCGLGPETVLLKAGFDIDVLIDSHAPLRERLQPLHRTLDWLHTGPLVFANSFGRPQPFYAAGDALSFVDPFTGSGQLAAVLTGMLAGECAARAIVPATYVARCRAALGPPFRWSAALRKLAGTAVAEVLLPVVPASLLYCLTRPQVA